MVDLLAAKASAPVNGAKILVTGGAGFIGSHLVAALVGEGREVIVVDDLSTGNAEKLPLADRRLRFEQMRIQDYRPGGERIDAIVHLAAIPSVQYAWDEPVAAHDATLTSTLAVIELARLQRCRRVVFSSSAAVYGDSKGLPLTEGMACVPLSPNGLQKLASEQYLAIFARLGKFSVVNLRFFNVFGPGQVPASPYSGVISRFVSSALAGLPLRIEGGGMQSRDFVFVDDVLRAIRKSIALALLQGGHGDLQYRYRSRDVDTQTGDACL